MNLAIGYSADRNGKIYKDAIKPDIPFTSIDKFNDIVDDEKVKAAMKWPKQYINQPMTDKRIANIGRKEVD